MLTFTSVFMWEFAGILSQTSKFCHFCMCLIRHLADTLSTFDTSFLNSLNARLHTVSAFLHFHNVLFQYYSHFRLHESHYPRQKICLKADNKEWKINYLSLNVFPIFEPYMKSYIWSQLTVFLPNQLHIFLLDRHILFLNALLCFFCVLQVVETNLVAFDCHWILINEVGAMEIINGSCARCSFSSPYCFHYSWNICVFLKFHISSFNNTHNLMTTCQFSLRKWAHVAVHHGKKKQYSKDLPLLCSPLSL